MKRILGSTALQLLRRFGAVQTAGIDPTTLLLDLPEDMRAVQMENGTVQIMWRFDAAEVEAFGGTRPDQIRWDTPLARATAQNALTVTGLDPNKRHYFGLRFKGGSMDGRVLTVAERHVALEGAVNLRDIGGYRTFDGRYVRWGLVYRAGELTSLSDAGRAFLVNDLDVKLICDLRGEVEIENAPERLLDVNPPEYLQVSLGHEYSPARLARVLFTGGADGIHQEMLAYYQRIVDTQAKIIGDLLRSLLDTRNLPTLFHCTAGKDRTGVLVALLLAGLGVPEETIMGDYALSNLAFPDLMADMERNERLHEVGIPAQMLTPVLIAHPDWLRTTLAHLRTEYGAVENYLHVAAGLDEETLDRLRDILLM